MPNNFPFMTEKAFKTVLSGKENYFKIILGSISNNKLVSHIPSLLVFVKICSKYQALVDDILVFSYLTLLVPPHVQAS